MSDKLFRQLRNKYEYLASMPHLASSGAGLIGSGKRKKKRSRKSSRKSRKSRKGSRKRRCVLKRSRSGRPRKSSKKLCKRSRKMKSLLDRSVRKRSRKRSRRGPMSRKSGRGLVGGRRMSRKRSRRSGKGLVGGRRMGQLADWRKFLHKYWKNNPGISYKQAMVDASKLYRR